VLGFLQCMSNIVINDGGTGLFAKLQVATLLHGDKYVFVTEASQLGFWSIGQVFSRYRNYQGDKDRPLTEQEMKHLNGLMDEATVVVNKFADGDPEQDRWLAQIRESFAGPHVSVVATPWDQSLANRVPLDLGAVAGSTLDAKLAMAQVVLHSADRAYRRRHGLPEEETEYSGNGYSGDGQWGPAGPDSPDAEPDGPDVRIIPAQPSAHIPTAVPDSPDAEPDTPDVRIIPARTGSDSTDTEPGTYG